MRPRLLIAFVTGALVLGTASIAGAAPTAPRWVTETGNHSWQYGYDVALDNSGNAWVVGATSGKFPKSGDHVAANATTAFVAEYNHRGGLAWSTQFGTTFTVATSVARDDSGNLDVVGRSIGAEFPGTDDVNAGGQDAFVRQYDGAGDHVWTHLLGSTKDDEALGVAADADGSVYVVGDTAGHLAGAPEAAGFEGDGWIAKYAADGTRAWVHQIATDRYDDITAVVAVPGGGVDVVGNTDGALAGDGSNLGNSDFFVAHYGSDGTRTWLRQLGTDSYDVGSGIAADASGDLFVVGVTPGALPGWTGATEFYGDAFLLELDAGGTQLAVRQFGAKGRDAGKSVAVDAAGNVFVAGNTDQHLRGAPETNSYGTDAFVARFAPAADHEFRTAWVHQIGAGTIASGMGIAVTPDGTATVAGWADGAVPGADRFRGNSDVFVARFARVS